MRHILEKYIWTSHAQYKMRYYRLSESLIKRVIRQPSRVEEGIIENAVACMQEANSKKYSEIWTMYVLNKQKQIKIITAWRYPGRSPERNPVPVQILEDAKRIIGT